MEFVVEGRYFSNPLFAFTFAAIQADRMLRPVEVHVATLGVKNTRNPYTDYMRQGKTSGTWHATAQPSNFVRSHLVAE